MVLPVSSIGTTQLMTFDCSPPGCGRVPVPWLARVAGDLVLFADWRAESEELLDDGGPQLAAALVGAARLGSQVSGLLWRWHPAAIGYTGGTNRARAQAVIAAGDRVLLDQRVRPLGAHHQEFAS